MASIPPGFPSLGSTYGSLLMGMGFTMALWGAATMQLYIYYNNFSKKDNKWLKSVVVFVYCLDTVHQVMLVQYIYVYLVTEFGNFFFLLSVDKNTEILTVISAFLEAVVQMLFVSRVWRLSGNKLVTGVLSALIIVQFVIIMVYFGEIINFTSPFQLISKINLSSAANAVVATTDILIAAVLVVLLGSNRSAFKSTNSVLNRLIVYTIASGAVTALCAIATLVTAQVFPETFIYLTLDLMMAKLYTNSMLAMLNSRQVMRNRMYNGSEDEGMSIRTSMLQGQGQLPISFAQVQVSTTETVMNHSQSGSQTRSSYTTVNEQIVKTDRSEPDRDKAGEGRVKIADLESGVAT